MPIPVAQAGAEQAWLFSSLPKTVTLSGNATPLPILGWRWTMLYVPPGSIAATGVNGDFVNGVATIQNPSFVCDVRGCYVLQLEVSNVDANGNRQWSIPSVDRELAQTPVYILTDKLSVRLPGAFLWRYDADLNQTLLDMETAINATSVDTTALHKATGGEISAMTSKSVPVIDDLLVVEDSVDSYNKKKVRVGDLPAGVDTTAFHKATAGEISVMTEKTTPVSADILVLEDSASSYVKKKVQVGNLTGGGVDTTALHKATANEISAMTEKAVPVVADLLVIEDSAAGAYTKKFVQIGNLPAATVSAKGLLPVLGGGTTNFLRADGSWSTPPSGGVDTTAIHKATAAEISAVTPKTTPIAADLLLIEDSESANAKKSVQIGNLPAATTLAKGLLPILGGGTTNFLRADGSWSAPGGGGGMIPPATKQIYVDMNRGDTYTPDGSILKPYLTISAAIAAITDAAYGNEYTVHIATGRYGPETAGDLICKSFVNLVGANRYSTFIDATVLCSVTSGYYVISDLTITGVGSAFDGPGIDFLNGGDLTINNCTVNTSSPAPSLRVVGGNIKLRNSHIYAYTGGGYDAALLTNAYKLLCGNSVFVGDGVNYDLNAPVGNYVVFETPCGFQYGKVMLPLGAANFVAAGWVQTQTALTPARTTIGDNPSVWLSSLQKGTTGFLTISNKAYFVYLGLTKAEIMPKFVEFYLAVVGTGTQAAEVGLFSSPAAPNKAAQVLTKIVASGTLDSLTAGVGVKRNTTALSYLFDPGGGDDPYDIPIPAYTHLWAGIRTAMGTIQPTITGLVNDMAQGQILATATSGALTAAGPWTGAIIAAALTETCPDLRATMD